jgi:hypothetical protein
MKLCKQATFVYLFCLVRAYGFVFTKKPFHVRMVVPIKEEKIQINVYMSAENKNGDVDYIKREEWSQDLISLGGDPSFLPDGYSDEDEWYDDAIDENENFEMPSMSLLGVAGIPSVVTGKMEEDEEEEDFTTESEDDFEWDGTENEDAYYD